MRVSIDQFVLTILRPQLNPVRNFRVVRSSAKICGAGDDAFVLIDATLRQLFTTSGLPAGIYTPIHDLVQEVANGGVDTVQLGCVSVTGMFGQVQTLSSLTLGANIENGQVLAGGAFDMIGNAANNALVGSTFSNMLTGVGGDDTLTGGGKTDTFSYAGPGLGHDNGKRRGVKGAVGGLHASAVGVADLDRRGGDPHQDTPLRLNAWA